jgi:RNA polymerase sigma-70 factor (ECF subfamily)
MRTRPQQSEEALMEAYVEGDADAFQGLFASLAPAVHGFFVRAVSDRSAVDDLTQTTFLKVHAARRLWRRGERVRPWVFTIAARVRVDWLRARGRAVADPLEDAAADAAVPPVDPGAEIDLRRRDERVRAALDALPESQRIVVHLHRFEGLGFADIGRILGISEGAARVRAFRANEELRTRLRDLARGGEGS